MKRLTGIWMAAVMVLGLAPLAHAEGRVFVIDPDHTTVGFSVSHMFSKTTGRFQDFDGTIEVNPKNNLVAGATGEVRTASVDTDQAKRDEHLRSPDFFDAKKFPTMSFTADKVQVSQDGTMRLLGNLTIRDVTKPVAFLARMHGIGNDPWGNTRLGLSAVTRINRKDYGMIYNKVLDNGGLLVGDEVDINLEVEAIEQKPKK